MLLLQSLGPRVGLWEHPHYPLDLRTLGFWLQKGQHPKQLTCSTLYVALALTMVLALPMLSTCLLEDTFLHVQASLLFCGHKFSGGFAAYKVVQPCFHFNCPWPHQESF